MSRLMILAGAGLLVGLGAGLAGRWATRPEAAVVPAATDSTAAAGLVDQPDSTYAESASIVLGAGAPVGDVLSDMLPAAAAAVSEAEPEPEPPLAQPAPPMSNPQLATAVPVLRGGVQGPDAAKRLARIFGAMRPAEAAAVLQQMEDADIREILFGMTERTAGAILGHLPPERAAALSRAALRRSTS